MQHTKKIVIGIPVKNTGLFLHNLISQLQLLNYDKKLIDIVFVEGDSTDDSYNVCVELKNKIHDFNKIEVDKCDFGFHLNHDESRWKPEFFKLRIQNLVRTRNYIVDNYTNQCDYLWWIDSDFELIPSDTLNKLIECDKDVVIPTLTNEKYEYHDCGSVIYINNISHRFQYLETTDNLVKLNRADCHCFIKSTVLKHPIRYTYIENVYYDGCGNVYPCYSDGTQFSFDCINAGYGVYAARHIKIKHANV